jgi:excisionase family DNA binding protein
MNASIEPLRLVDAIPNTAFLSRSAVARLFGVSLSTVTRWARTGVLPAARTPGGHYRFRAEDMRRAVDASGPNRPI